MQRRAFLFTFVLGSGALLCRGASRYAIPNKKGTMTIHMIYNNTGSHEGLENAWGLAEWIEHDGDVTLFDTGGDAKVLWRNMQALGLDPGRINRIVISHDHWDHQGGLKLILEKSGQPVDLFVVSADEKKFREKYPSARVHGISEGRPIHDSIWSTGMMTTSYKTQALNEQSLLILRGDSMVILTGCSHPGIVEIVEQAIQLHPDKKIKLVGGGFHLMRKRTNTVVAISNRLKQLGVEQIAPSHCTGKKAIKTFRSEWGKNFVELNLGDRITV